MDIDSAVAGICTSSDQAAGGGMYASARACKMASAAATDARRT
jgi:hypothetical protein